MALSKLGKIKLLVTICRLEDYLLTSYRRKTISTKPVRVQRCVVAVQNRCRNNHKIGIATKSSQSSGCCPYCAVPYSRKRVSSH